MLQKQFFCLRSRTFLLLGHKFAWKPWYVFQFCQHEGNINLFPVLLINYVCSNRERTTKIDGEVETDEPQAGHRKGKGKKKKKELERRGDKVSHTLYEDRTCLWDVARWRLRTKRKWLTDKSMNRCHLNVLCVAWGRKYVKKSSPDFFGSHFIIMRMRDAFFFENNVSSFSHRGLKTSRKHNKKQCFHNNVS